MNSKKCCNLSIASNKYEYFKTKNFSLSAVILWCLSRYCYQLIFSEIFSLPFSAQQVYKYKFSKNEIEAMKKLRPEEFSFNKNFVIDYDFTLTTFNLNYKGIIKIKTKFINNFSFENSFYKIHIEIKNNTGSMSIYPFFLTEKGMKAHLSEFIQKLWTPIFIHLVRNSYVKTISTECTNNKNLTTILVDESYIHKHLHNIHSDLICDIFHITCHSLFSKNSDDKLIISCDDIMATRGLKKNPNANGRRGGFKKIEKEKIETALTLLNDFGLLHVTKFDNFKYIVSIPSKFDKLPRTTIPRKIVEYNHKTHIWHRRIGLKLVQNKVNKIQVKELLKVISNLYKSFKPIQIRDKFERVLDDLCDDEIIKSWHYKNINENTMSGKNWLSKWENLTIICRY